MTLLDLKAIAIGLPIVAVMVGLLGLILLLAAKYPATVFGTLVVIILTALGWAIGLIVLGQ